MNVCGVYVDFTVRETIMRILISIYKKWVLELLDMEKKKTTVNVNGMIDRRIIVFFFFWRTE